MHKHSKVKQSEELASVLVTPLSPSYYSQVEVHKVVVIGNLPGLPALGHFLYSHLLQLNYRQSNKTFIEPVSLSCRGQDKE